MRNIAITGASAEIGQAIVRHLAQAGFINGEVLAVNGGFMQGV